MDEDADGSVVYGFDCNHAGDADEFGRTMTGGRFPDVKIPRWTEDMVALEVEKLLVVIRAAAEFEEAYTKAPTQEVRAKVLDLYHESLRAHGIEFDLSDNLGAMISVFSGHL
jgi:hypothetical protein